ncbi:hypothetical protein GUJ93_ZPchr0001g31155 [Zizania palustris]|uniref:ATP-dependent Clp protease proteolytic subunit n=1 Tax=Zizania palustris TaxID=103762 RepID=A0A8J5VS39_ZIZPA|nr:hypothetical protein GUJ93_ZPchr0001g31155 [Zizania palustris]
MAAPFPRILSGSVRSPPTASAMGMEAAAAAFSPPRVFLDARTMFASASSQLRLAAGPRALAIAPAAAPAAASTRPRFLAPPLPDPAGGGHSARDVVAMVVPFLRGTAWQQPPPDLASFLYKNRIVYLGMCLVPSVTELMLAEFLYLQYEDAEKPIYLYINSTGTTKNGEKLGYETEAFAIYDAMRYVKVPIFTLCVGNAWGEAALLLAAGAKGNRAALPSSTIMIKQPIGRFQGQATDVDIARKEIRNVKIEMVKLLSRHIGKSAEQIAQDIKRPKYFSPSEAVDYGIIDKVLYNEKIQEDGGVVSELKRSNLI